MNKITTVLMFNDQAEAAMNFYTSVFKDSKIHSQTRVGNSVVAGVFELNGTTFYCYNGGSSFTFSQGMSLYVPCDTQSEIDYYWDALSAAGASSRCGWLSDQFGISWQIVPSNLGQLLGNKDPLKAQKVTQALLAMDKLSIAGLEAAAA